MSEECCQSWNENIETVELESDLDLKFIRFSNYLGCVVHTVGSLMEELDHVRLLSELRKETAS